MYLYISKPVEAVTCTYISTLRLCVLWVFVCLLTYFCMSLVCLFVCLYISLHVSLSESLLGVLHVQYVCTWATVAGSCLCSGWLCILFVYFICVLVSHRCVSLLVRVWALDVWGELAPSKIFNPPFPVLKAGHLVSYSCVRDVLSTYMLPPAFFGGCVQPLEQCTNSTIPHFSMTSYCQ